MAGKCPVLVVVTGITFYPWGQKYQVKNWKTETETATTTKTETATKINDEQLHTFKHLSGCCIKKMKVTWF